MGASAHVVESDQMGSNADWFYNEDDEAKADDDCILGNHCNYPFLTRQLTTQVSMNIVGSDQTRMQVYSNAADTYKQDNDPWRSQTMLSYKFEPDVDSDVDERTIPSIPDRRPQSNQFLVKRW